MQVSRQALHKALKELVLIADQRSALPILSHVLLQATAGGLTLTTSDLKQALSCQIPAEGEIETCLPARLLANLIKPEGRGDDGDLVVEVIDETSCALTFDGLTSRLVPLNPEMFPAALTRDENWSLLAMWSTADLREALSFVLPAASADDGRPHLNCIALDLEKLVATDGHRLHMASLPTKLPETILLPLESAKMLDRLLKHADRVILARSGDVVRMRIGPWQLDSKLVDAKFPPYEKVIPAETPTQMTVEGAVLSKALSRITRLSKNSAVRLNINGKITIATSDPDLGSATVDVPIIETNHEGDDIVLGVNPAYLVDATSPTVETVTFGMSGATDAVRIELGEGRTAIVMPMRL